MEYIYVSMNALASTSYDPIEKIVPLEYEGRPLRTLVEFMTQESDAIGNAPLSDTEQELAQTIRSWIKAETQNTHVIVDVMNDPITSHRLSDVIDQTMYSPEGEIAIDGEFVEYDRLDIRLRKLHTGG